MILVCENGCKVVLKMVKYFTHLKTILITLNIIIALFYHLNGYCDIMSSLLSSRWEKKRV
jgi:hypothetical protein